MASKVIVLGSLDGKLETAFQKLATLHSKNQFAFAIITGNLFSIDQDESVITRLLEGKIAVPLTTYFTVGTIALPPQIVERIEKNEEICENLHFLGKRSIITTSDGIRIVTLGGILDREIVSGTSKEQHLPFHTINDATALRGANKTDILLTSTWSSNVWVNSKVPLNLANKQVVTSSPEVAELCSALKPRYHLTFSPADFFYEREPFFYSPAHGPTDAKQVTRFISMAPYGSPAKEKSLYAFNLEAGVTPDTLPPGSTLTPFNPPRGAKRVAAGADGYTGRFAQDHHDGPSRRRRRQRSPPPDPSRCFFCLSNENLATHMICSIGEEAYITTAKGPLPPADHFSGQGLNFPGHQIIIPLAHEPTMRAIHTKSPNAFAEMTRLRDALQAMIATQSNYSLGVVTWEISRANNIHLHWQLMPVPSKLIRDGLIELGFKAQAEDTKHPHFEERDIGPGEDETNDFLRLWLWSDDGDTGIMGKQLVMPIDDTFRFDLQLPRKVLAKFLNLENRIRWQDVEQSVAEETQDADHFKAAFKKWDFTLG
ncbi:CwfJ C-terminus 1-domain-containing protein-like protein [Apiospora phragmitis]|uniref:CwfJ C-terminus 1-domain-containing protein-like protein n=1 Tax=Apiospora phragmitis TaxID=2905665 RepID=A0ABR1TX56_9PEZI